MHPEKKSPRTKQKSHETILVELALPAHLFPTEQARLNPSAFLDGYCHGTFGTPFADLVTTVLGDGKH